VNRSRLLIIAIAITLVASIVQPASLLCQDDSSKEPDTENVYRMGPDITPPRAIYAPDPTYDDVCGRAKIRGIVILSIIVTSDGNAKDVKVTKQLSPSLDQRAIDTVARWRFTPQPKTASRW
jgi:TonB family protein